MVSDVATGDSTRLLCLNCARRVVSPRFVSKYGGLTSYLKFRSSFTNVVKLSFARMDGIIGDNLPMSAYRDENWWSNLPTNVHSKAWVDAGWEVQEVNLKKGYAVFKKAKEVRARSFKRRVVKGQVKKPFTPVRVRIPRSKAPSKTKVSKLYARVKNLERQRSSMPVYHGSFKQKRVYEKRLFKSEEKPR
jgi:hypothetical protein